MDTNDDEKVTEPRIETARSPEVGFLCRVCKKPIAGLTTWTGMSPGDGPAHAACEGGG